MILPFVRLLDAGQHLEQRRLAGAIGTDDADDAAGRQLEAQIVDEELVAEGLGQPLDLDHHLAETRPRRDRERGLAHVLASGLLDQLVEGGDARLGLGLARLRRGADPFELASDLLLAAFLGRLLDLGALGLLLEPARVIALVGDALAAIELQRPVGEVVEEVAVVRDEDHAARVFLEIVLEPGDAFGVEVVRGLVEQQDVGLRQQEARQRHAPLLAA